MSFITSNIIRFQGKSRKGSEDVKIREQILTLQNLYQSYSKNFLLLSELPSLQNSNELVILKENMAIIEQQIEKLAILIK
ncbi:MAG: hypothetical protein ABS949_07630 [Solibacillus sp.]